MSQCYSSAGAGAIPYVNSKIKQRKVVLFSKRWDPQCKNVKSIMDEYNLKLHDYEVCELDGRQDINQIECYFQQLCLTDSRSVPQLFINGHYVGGEKEIPRLHEDGKLKRLLPYSKVFSMEEQSSSRMSSKDQSNLKESSKNQSASSFERSESRVSSTGDPKASSPEEPVDEATEEVPRKSEAPEQAPTGLTINQLNTTPSSREVTEMLTELPEAVMISVVVSATDDHSAKKLTAESDLPEEEAIKDDEEENFPTEISGVNDQISLEPDSVISPLNKDSLLEPVSISSRSSRKSSMLENPFGGEDLDPEDLY